MTDIPIYMLPVGTRLHGFLITEVLGQGGFGITYKAEDTRLNRIVVIKEYLPQSLASRLANKTVTPNSTGLEDDFRYGLASFLREAQTLAHFQQANIVPVLEFFEANNTAYIVMPYLTGETLENRLSRQGTMTGKEVNAWLYPVLDGLQTIHAEGFLHRDIKPGNIYLRDNGQPVLIDFGAARNALGNRNSSLSIILTPGYAPMEQYGGNAANQGPWTDIYALGGVIYRCITGSEPADSTERQDAAINGETDPLQTGFDQIAKATNPAFASTVTKCMRIARKDRIQGVAELRQSLQNQNPDAHTEIVSDNLDQPEKQQSDKTQIVENSKPSKKKRGCLKIFLLLIIFSVLFNLSDKEPSDLVMEWVSTQYPRIFNLFVKEPSDTTITPKSDESTQIVKEAPDTIAGLFASAKKGDAAAQTEIGKLYLQGKTVEKNGTEAAEWFKRAAEQGYGEAQYYLGMCYGAGIGLNADKKEAIKWYEKAASQGNAKAQAMLGWYYEHGDGVEKNEVTAINWYQLAAKQGNVDAQKSLRELGQTW